MVSLHRSVFCIHHASFNYRKDIPLDSLSRYVSARSHASAGSDLVDLVDEDDAVLLCIMESLVCHLIHVDELLSLLLLEDPPRIADLAFLLLGLLWHHGIKDVTDRYHALVLLELICLRYIVYFYLNDLVFKQALFELFSDLIPCHLDIRVLFALLVLLLLVFFVLLLLGLVSEIAEYISKRHSAAFVLILRPGDDGIDDYVLCKRACHLCILIHPLLFAEPHGSFHKVSYHGVYVAAYITDFGKLSCFYLHERRIHKLRKSPSDLCLTYSGRSHHQDVLRRYFFPHLLGEFASPVSITKRYSDILLGLVLPDNVLVKLRYYLFRSHVLDIVCHFNSPGVFLPKYCCLCTRRY